MVFLVAASVATKNTTSVEDRATAYAKQYNTAYNAAKLKKFVSESGKILPRRITGNCARHQIELTSAIKRARHLALMPYVAE